ncbi:MAG: hypothetical protein H6Q10_3698, partial [Acidobacteria bacterium]|nr:hypothetical protein [Acidobacteriota bacterium]
PQGLVAAGLDAPAADDAPLLHLLEDVHAEAVRLAVADTGCHNIVVVLVAAGDQEPAIEPPLDRRALDFLRVGGRRVPIHVVALAPGAASARLAGIAAATGGRYTEIQPPAEDGDTVEDAVHAVVRAVNTAVQHGLARFADVSVPRADGGPPAGESEYSVAAPLVATVDLEQARGAAGQLLPDTRITAPDGSVIPQRSNVTITAGFALPGFAGRLRGFRVYRPEADAGAVLGYRFVADGTRLWTAAAPAPDRRNLFTVVPGHGVVALSEANAALLAPYLATGDAAAAASLIRYVRRLPLGAPTHSTPALLTPPAGDDPDAGYRAFLDANRARRALVFFGADDGMLHAVDARTGVEAWAIVPFNLLPKLRLLLDGQPLDEYRFFVGGSPRIADVRTGGGWKTILVVGEGPGGTFYQAFDVTLPGIAQALGTGGDSADALLGFFSDAGRIPFLWSFPSYARFDAALPPFGDVSAAASEAEKSVGETWSTPSVFRTGGDGSPVVLTGSGPLPASAERQANRGRIPAGRTLYLLDAGTGALLDASRVEADGLGEDQDRCPQAGCTAFKNALAADPAVLLGTGSAPARAYIGDLDGRLWRYEVRQEAEGPRFAGTPRLVYEGPASEPIFAAAGLARPGFDRTFVFLATGSDLAPSARGAPTGRLLALEDAPAGVALRGEIVLGATGIGEERVSSLPALAGDVVFFSTTYSGGTACDPGTGRLYALTFGWGAAYDWSGDGRRDRADFATLRAAAPGRVSAPTAADRHVLVAAWRSSATPAATIRGRASPASGSSPGGRCTKPALTCAEHGRERVTRGGWPPLAWSATRVTGAFRAKPSGGSPAAGPANPHVLAQRR